MAVTNVASYAFTALASRWLGPAAYGEFAAVMALVLVVNVLSLALQATAARRVAAAPGHRAEIEARVGAMARRAAGLLAVVCIASAPVTARSLDLDTPVTAALLAVPAASLAVMGAQAGILQGEERWGGFSAIFVTFGLGRLACGLIAVSISPTPVGAMAGVAVGSLLPVGVGHLVLRRSRRASAGGRSDAATPRPTAPAGFGTETWRNAHLLLAFFVLSGMDVVLARVVLADMPAGQYAAGAILAKAVLFLPYFVTAVAFPALARGHRHRLHLWGLAFVGLIGASVTIVVALLPDLSVEFVGGDAYAQTAGRLWAFAILGTTFAGIQLLVYSALARRHAHAVWVVWAGVIAIAGAGVTVVTTAGWLLVACLAVAGAVLAALTALTWRDDSLGAPAR